MQTRLTDSPEEAAKFIIRGGVVAFPTETVYGLGANVFDAVAVSKIFEAKRRPADNPLIVHVASLEQIASVAAEITPAAQIFINEFFPGPLTVVLKRSAEVPLIATAGLETIGVRMPRSETANRFLRACGVPVSAPSANLSGRPSPTTWRAVLEDLDGRIDCILRGDATEVGLESTVVDCTVDPPLLLRAGSVSLDDLKRVVPETEAFSGTSDKVLPSPGLRHRHYSPRAVVEIVSSSDAIDTSRPSAYIGVRERDEAFELQRICGSVEQYAHDLFEFFRECDRQGIERIYCEAVAESGIGAALMDRLRRAAEK